MIHVNEYHIVCIYKVLILMLIPYSVNYAQERLDIEGISNIIHYTKEDYGFETQFWSMAEDDEGIIYFGTNWGISILNGKEWKSLEITNGSDVRAVYHSKDNRIIVGGYNEIGEIKRDEFGRFYYESFLGSLSNDEIDFNSIWQIVSVDDKIIFRSFTKLIILSENKTAFIPTNNSFKSIDVLEGNIFVTTNEGVFLLNTERLELEKLVGPETYNNEHIITISHYENNKALIFTRQGNSYVFNYEEKKIKFDKAHLKTPGYDQIFCVTRNKNGVYLLGTINNYIKYYDPQKPNTENYRRDIQDKTVLNIYESSNGNIWALLNRGVDCINNAFPGSLILKDASVYDSEFFQNRLLIATNQGTYISNVIDGSQQVSTDDFKLLPGLEAQTWSIQSIDGTIFIGHDQGAFYINENLVPVYIEGTDGIWKVIAVPGYDNMFLACGYDGLYLIKKNNAGYRMVQKVDNFDESSRDIMPGKVKGEFWICHGYKGVFRIKLDQNLTRVIFREHFTENDGLPTRYGVNVCEYNGEALFLTEQGPYEYVETENKFMPHEALHEIFSGNKAITKLTQYEQTVWFVQDNSMGFFSLSAPDNLYKNQFESLDGSFITSMEHFLPINSQTIIVGTNTGLYQFRHTSPNTLTKFPTYITEASFRDGSDNLKLLEINPTEKIELSHDINSLIFKFSAPQFRSNKDVKYKYKLENFNQSWSDWTTEFSKEYSYLKPGSYEFKVMAKDNLNTQSEVTSYHFTILPPWYQTNLARAFAVTILLLLMTGIILGIRRRYKKSLLEQERLSSVLELELKHVELQREKENILKSNYQLRDNVVNKSKELANYTLKLANNHDLMNEIQKSLEEIKKEAKLNKTKSRIRELTQKISTNLNMEEHLEIFDTNFEKVHQSFFTDLKARYPMLTQKEIRLCGFIKMDMSNKEIASVLNISLRGVETARYRLRKHLDLDQTVNLVEFFNQ